MDVYVKVYVNVYISLKMEMSKMVSVEQDKPIYGERVNEILRGIAAGKTREELAEEAGNTNWKSIDMYMRRRNFSWDSRMQTYAPKIEPIEQDFSADSSKAGHVISLLSKEGADARTVAERVGFRDHRELAQYMNVKGYVWDGDKNNYIRQVGEILSQVEDAKTEETAPSYPQNSKTSAKKITDTEDFDRFIPLLEMLENHRERLLDLIVPTSQTGTIPRYIIPGVAKTKTVQMMNTIEQLVVDFSREKNISQRELFEVALIGFFRNYGYEQEVEQLLTR
jgi:hypothetical protein